MRTLALFFLLLTVSAAEAAATVAEAVAEAVADQVAANYFLPTVADSLACCVRDRARRGDYDDLTAGTDLAARLTADLQALVPDRHLKVLFSAEPRPLRDSASEPSAAEIARHERDAARQNFGLERVEHLDGNVGYLKLKKFEDPLLAGEAITAALRLLANTDALLIDLRLNGGGHGETVELLTSYLLDPAAGAVHLADLATRGEATVKQSWSLPYVPGPRYAGKPVFILTAAHTFSAAEGFAYNLQAMKRATVVGERTGGGAHFVRIFQIDEHFAVMVPIGTVTSTFTGANWEGAGVTPDVEVPAADALRTAHVLALRALLETTNDDYADHLRTLIAEMEAQP